MKDIFSKRSAEYVRYRPAYPQQLYDFIFQHIAQNNTAWDCATGTGQAAFELSKRFKKVFATDISQQQLAYALKADNIFYSLQLAEKTNFPDHSFDLITVAQAIHWLQFDDFYKEVKRVAKPDAIIAVWGYSLLKASDEIDKILNNFYTEILGSYWDEERKYVDDHYATIPFPFNEIESPSFQLTVYWDKKELEGYLFTWSALQKYLQANQSSPLPQLMREIEKHWGTQEKIKIIFPLFLRLGRI
jgi:cyclopropane fatty-acyl-phospholipid synthase-like methyltransferase